MRDLPRLVIALAALPEVPGTSASSDSRKLPGFTLDADGLQIRVERPVEVEIASDSIVVRILPR